MIKISHELYNFVWRVWNLKRKWGSYKWLFLSEREGEESKLTFCLCSISYRNYIRLFDYDFDYCIRNTKYLTAVYYLGRYVKIASGTISAIRVTWRLFRNRFSMLS